ncbi:hypothetical protein [uncultured Cetobacterium sp.]|uniref:hypothetical protein n=1 Tax=uncultured Cetobacterium sp. TaxID=527638 RepID=UPI0026103AB7|nr:hypothetical protein [uncultured Cetobacterium sp.]
MKKISLLLFLSFFYLSCTNSSIYNKNLSTYTIESNVVENQTTQNEIENIFGKPYSVDINNDGNTVWTYRDVTINSPGYNSFSASFRAGKGSRSRDNHNPQYKWVIIFDSNGVVVDFNVRSLY